MVTSQPLIGQTGSRYRVIERLGSQGSGSVYKAESIYSSGNYVALKFLTESLTGFQKRFLSTEDRRYATATALNHLNICNILDIGEHNGCVFIVMQYLKGKTLKRTIAHQPLKIDQLLHVAIGVTDGLDNAHRFRLVHRAITPASIFITEAGTPMILHFGLATQDADSENLSSPDNTLGTTAYMSPEQVRRAELDGRTDLFSFGAVLYEAATGQLPFRGDTTEMVFEAILNRAPAPLTELNPSLPPRLEEIINKSLEKDQNLRYQHASDFRADFSRLKRDTNSVGSWRRKY
jgi:eukaryotic-like serine/threonine-protein kinase